MSPAPPLQRRTVSRRSFPWIDPRLVVGLFLVIAAIGGVVAIVHVNDQRTPVYTAARTLAPGDPVTADAVHIQQVRLGDGHPRYYSGADAFPEGAQITRVVEKGELLPRSAVANANAADVSSIVISLPGALPRAVAAGAQVEVWAVRQVDHFAFESPDVVTTATVARVTEPSSVTVGSAFTVELRVPRDLTGRLLEAIANKDALSLVPIGMQLDGVESGDGT